MIKKLLLIPLLMLSSCTFDNVAYENVQYVFNNDSRKYDIYVVVDKEQNKTKTYEMSPKNYYEIQVLEYKTNKNGEHIYNEYLVTTNELFVYYK